MSTPITICNIALSQLGASLINSFDEGTTESTLCNVFFDQARSGLIASHPWNFAIARQEIAPDATAPLFDYSYQFTLPAACLRVLQVYEDADYKIEGRKILSHKNTCFIKYLVDEEDTSKWSQSFVDLVAAKLRLDLSYPITKSSTETQVAKALFDEVLMRAKAIDASEDIQDPYGQFDNEFISVRS